MASRGLSYASYGRNANRKPGWYFLKITGFAAIGSGSRGHSGVVSNVCVPTILTLDDGLLFMFGQSLKYNLCDPNKLNSSSTFDNGTSLMLNFVYHLNN